jgi:hypothetical protein
MAINHEGTWQDKEDFEAYRPGESISFDRSYPDGGLRVAIDGYTIETFHMSAEQFAAFKQWIMEN